MSLIKANAVQIGQSNTATQNFTLAVPSSPDGTIKLARGNAGATTQDVMNVSNAGVVSFPQGLGNISNSTAIATGSTTARSLANRFADVVNVKDFGAVGDGVADDTAALQAAIDYAITNKGVLNFEQGKTYKISLWLKFFKDTSPGSGVYLPIGPFGVNGNNATIIAAPTMPYNFTGCLIDVESASNFFIKDLILDGNGINRTINPALDIPVSNLQVYASDNFRIENVTSNNSPIDGIFVSERGTTKSTNFSIRNCYCEYNGRQGISLTGVSDFVIDGCNLSNTGQGGFFQTAGPCAGIDLEGDFVGYYPENGVVSNNTFRNNRGAGVVVWNGSNIVVNGNTIINHTTNSSFGNNSIHIGGIASYLTISNNVLYNNINGIKSEYNASTIDNKNLIIIGNSVNGCIEYSLKLPNGTKGISVIGNIFNGCTSVPDSNYAVEPGDLCEVFSNNIITNIRKASTTGSGFYFANANGVCANNIIQDGATGNAGGGEITAAGMLIGNYFNATAIYSQGSVALYDGLNPAKYGVVTCNRDVKRTSTSQLDGRRIVNGSAVPTTGTWERGDIVYFTQPSASSWIGAICTASGTPGTWKFFATIST
jgi:parallel beta-helix repeat protein